MRCQLKGSEYSVSHQLCRAGMGGIPVLSRPVRVETYKNRWFILGGGADWRTAQAGQLSNVALPGFHYGNPGILTAGVASGLLDGRAQGDIVAGRAMGRPGGLGGEGEGEGGEDEVVEKLHGDGRLNPRSLSDQVDGRQ
jgi:hypothetical protein